MLKKYVHNFTDGSNYNSMTFFPRVSYTFTRKSELSCFTALIIMEIYIFRGHLVSFRLLKI